MLLWYNSYLWAFIPVRFAFTKKYDKLTKVTPFFIFKMRNDQLMVLLIIETEFYLSPRILNELQSNILMNYVWINSKHWLTAQKHHLFGNQQIQSVLA